MHRLSIVQALDIWSDLMSAYDGKNPFGGSVAEIYIYRLMPSCPALVTVTDIQAKGLFGDDARQTYDNANASLFAILTHFAEEHFATVFVDGRALGPWLKRARYTHRVHVTVRPRRKLCRKKGRSER